MTITGDALAASIIEALAPPLAAIRAIPDPLPPTPPTPPFVLGETMPGPGLVGAGVLGPVTKTVTAAMTTIKTSGTYRDTRFEGWVDVAAPWVQFVNCEFVGPITYTAARPLVKVTSSAVLQATFSFCTMAARKPGGDELDGIVGFNYRLDRCDIHHVDDGLGVFAPGNVIVTGTWVHDLVWFAKAQHDDGTHNDCLQVHNGGRLVVLGSRLDAYLADDAGDQRTSRVAMSAVMLSPMPSSGGTLDLLFADSWVNGGQVGFNFGGWRTALGERRILTNEWSTDVSTPILAKAELPLIIAGNTKGGVAADGRRNG